jgi:hypothetical protein
MFEKLPEATFGERYKYALDMQNSREQPVAKSQLRPRYQQKDQLMVEMPKARGTRGQGRPKLGAEKNPPVEGLHRLEAAKALGEKTVICFLVDARKH